MSANPETTCPTGAEILDLLHHALARIPELVGDPEGEEYFVGTASRHLPCLLPPFHDDEWRGAGCAFAGAIWPEALLETAAGVRRDEDSIFCENVASAAIEAWKIGAVYLMSHQVRGSARQEAAQHLLLAAALAAQELMQEDPPRID